MSGEEGVEEGRRLKIMKGEGEGEEKDRALFLYFTVKGASTSEVLNSIGVDSTASDSSDCL